MKPIVVVVLFAGAACAGHRTPVPATSAELPYAGPDGVRYGCLPRAGDSTQFAIDVIVDSLQRQTGAGLTLVREERAAPQPGVVSQSVTAEIQLGGQTRVYGTVCSHDAGVVVRGTERALNEARLSVNASGNVLVHVRDPRGRALGETVRSPRPGTTEPIRWHRSP